MNLVSKVAAIAGQLSQGPFLLRTTAVKGWPTSLETPTMDAQPRGSSAACRRASSVNSNGPRYSWSSPRASSCTSTTLRLHGAKPDSCPTREQVHRGLPRTAAR